MRIHLAKDLREANLLGANENRRMLADRGVLMVNLIGSPGSGKTSVLEHTLRQLTGRYRTAIIEGDLYTSADAERVFPWCDQVVQINTEGGCHLEAGAIGRLLEQEGMLGADLVVVENVGNLVCPAAFDLGEDIRVTQLSVAEGDDKPRKYPTAFRDAHCALITKTDLLPYCRFDLQGVVRDLRAINSELTIIPMSVVSGEGLELWLSWLERQIEVKKRSVLN